VGEVVVHARKVRVVAALPQEILAHPDEGRGAAGREVEPAAPLLPRLLDDAQERLEMGWGRRLVVGRPGSAESVPVGAEVAREQLEKTESGLGWRAAVQVEHLAGEGHTRCLAAAGEEVAAQALEGPSPAVANPAVFDAWLKHLRREGLPFAPEELGRGPGVNVTYRYAHIMELAVAVAPRAQAVLPGDLVRLLIGHRAELWPLYRRAYLERDTGLGAPAELHLVGGRELLTARGTYLEFLLTWDHPGHLWFMPPDLLGPTDATRRFARKNQLTYTRPPLPLSDIATDVVRLAGASPEIRRGRP
jgi:hypothetical protein